MMRMKNGNFESRLMQRARYAFYSLLSLVLTREAAENMGRTDIAVSPTYFNI
jgi:hypothetical protein